MSEVIYSTVIRTEGRKRDKMEMTVDIYESADSIKDHDFRTDTNTQHPQQQTGSECARNRRLRSVLVCLVVLCVLLLTAVIVLCVLIYTNNHKCHINYKNITQEGDELRAKCNNVTEQNKLLNQTKNELLKYLHEGWKYYEFSLYYFSSKKKSWTESRRYCEEKGADLIIINNKEEQDFVKTISDSENHWIGLSDSDEEGRWTWVDGSTLTYSSWRYHEPDGQRRENCAVSYTSVWYDYSCDSGYKWICEKSIN
ncbi:CD209 antigen-like protein C [Triplophysa rosa]|uniref:CD209 antigen-like protein C n=1 Tax=Triplophysa rosa TaxID=992332 RepID=UPI0025460A14|nr:CD209 antigen-like protein C [Triplophysa rosa]XP_057184489.1 CD209 antigen-like protein C [Triplophysa rosa]